MVRISVVIPTYNRAHMLPEIVAALQSQDFPAGEYEVIIVDDGSKDGTREYLEQLRPPFRGFTQKHGGASRARNLASQNSQGKILAFTDDDCRPEGDWLRVIDESMQQNRDSVALLGNTYSKFPSTTFVHSVFKDSEPVVTCNFAVPRDAFSRTGGFDEHFIIYFEDEDMGLRLKKNGCPIVYEPRMRVEHPSRYQSFRKFLGLRSGVQYLCYMSQKHPENDHWHRHGGVIRQIRIKGLLFGLPLLGGIVWPPLFALLVLILLAHFVVDGRRAWEHRTLLEPTGFRLRPIDFMGFTFLGWALPFVDAFRIVKGCIRDRGRIRSG